ncbi:MAG: glutamate-cysteine ligase family protein [bacterium]
MSSLVLEDATLIEERAQLSAWMLAGAKPSSRWVVGTEHEKFGWLPDEGRFPGFEGPRGIGALLERLAAGGWAATREGDDIIALSRGKATITLEPAGQLELSGAPLRTLDEVAAELDDHLDELTRVGADLGILWSGLGVAPTGDPTTWPRVPKARYGIMRRYLPTRGRLALYMMHGTCSIQANYDFADEADAMAMLRLSLLMQPLVMAMFANSPVLGGKLLPERSFRARIWEETDDARYRYPARLLAPGATLDDYIEWALDVPMFFIVRGGKYLECTGLPFRRFLAEGLGPHRATLGDFGLHLSTLFPDARLKQHLEVRGADMGSRADVVAVPALHMGLFYDKPTLHEALALWDDVDAAALAGYRRVVAVEGLHGRLGKASAQEWSTEMIRLAKQGLSRWQPSGERYLDGLAERVRQGRCPADDLRDVWTGDVGALMAATRIA